MPLIDTFVRKVKPSGKAADDSHTDGGGMYLLVNQDRAQGLLEDFIDDVLATELIEQQQAIKDDAVIQAINQKYGFWRGVGQNVVAGFLATAITLGVTLGAFLYSAEGPSRIWAALFEKAGDTSQ